MAQDAYQQSEQSVRDPWSPRPDRSMPGVDVIHAGHRPTVHVVGRVDRDKITEVSGAVRGLVAVGVRELVVDLSGSWDGTGLLPVLARTRAALAERGGTLRLVGLALPEYLAALRTAPLDEVFLIYDAVRPSPRADVPAPRPGDAAATEQPVPDVSTVARAEDASPATSTDPATSDAPVAAPSRVPG